MHFIASFACQAAGCIIEETDSGVIFSRKCTMISIFQEVITY